MQLALLSLLCLIKASKKRHPQHPRDPAGQSGDRFGLDCISSPQQKIWGPRQVPASLIRLARATTVWEVQLRQESAWPSKRGEPPIPSSTPTPPVLSSPQKEHVCTAKVTFFPVSPSGLGSLYISVCQCSLLSIKFIGHV